MRTHNAECASQAQPEIIDSLGAAHNWHYEYACASPDMRA